MVEKSMKIQEAMRIARQVRQGDDFPIETLRSAIVLIHEHFATLKRDKNREVRQIRKDYARSVIERNPDLMK